MGRAPVVHFTDREIHSFGTYAAVCWNTREEVRFFDGGRREIMQQRVGTPYLSFVSVELDTNGRPYEYDNHPLEGGMTIGAARQLQEELAAAIAYLEEQLAQQERAGA